MVIHDPLKQEQWTETRVAREREKEKHREKKPRRGWSVVAVQSLACGVLLGFALLFRLAGGDAYEQLKTGFHTALQNNELMAVLSRLWDGDPFADVEEVAEEDVKPSDFTSSENP